MQGEIINVPSNNHSTELRIVNDNFDDLFSQFIAFIDATPNTVRTYSTSLRQFFKYLAENSVQSPTAQTVRDYRAYLQASGKKPTTIQNYIVAVKQFFKWTEEAGIYKDIARHIKGAKISHEHKKDYLTSTQARHVLETIDRTSLKGKRDYAILALMLTSALRTIEVTRIDIEDMRTQGDNTVLAIQGKGHNDKDDIVRIPSHVELAIREYLTAKGTTLPQSPMFTSASNHNEGQRMTTRSISRIVKNSFIQAGYDSPRLTAHSTRHTSATLSLLNGATLQETQQLLRHVNVQTTEIYAHNLKASSNKSSQLVDNAIFSD